MKKLIMLFAIASTLFSCSNEEHFTQNTEIVGTWKLVAIFLHKGDGTGAFHKVNSEEIITFYLNKTFKAEWELCTEGNYTINSHNTGEMNFTNCPPLGMINAPYNYEIQGDLLTVGHGCVEKCGNQYIKITNEEESME